MTNIFKCSTLVILEISEFRYIATSFSRRAPDEAISSMIFSRTLFWASISLLYYIMVLNFINILLQCISTYIILPHQIHLFNRLIRQIFQNILSESIRHLIKLARLTHSIRLFLQGQSLYHGLPIPLLQEFRVLHLHLLQHPISLILCCIQNL